MNELLNALDTWILSLSRLEIAIALAVACAVLIDVCRELSKTVDDIYLGR